MKKPILFVVLTVAMSLTWAQDTPVVTTKQGASGTPVTITFEKGAHHNHPLMAIWLQNEDSTYLETLYVAQSVATSTYPFGRADKGQWKEGVHRRPAALPYWAHNRGVMAQDSLYIPHPDNPMPDAITGATPKGSFRLNSVLPENIVTPFYVLVEINQSWDWNDYWTNDKFPDNKEYKTSAQPAVVYRTKINTIEPGAYHLELVGRSHHSGANGKLYLDMHTMSTAKTIAEEIKIIIP